MCKETRDPYGSGLMDLQEQGAATARRIANACEARHRGPDHVAATIRDAIEVLTATLKAIEAGNVATQTAGGSDKTTTQQPARITEQQRTELVSLIQDSGANIDRLLAFCKVKVLKQIPAAVFPKLKAMLQKKIDAHKPAVAMAS
jgi:hypothetical protein